MPHVPYFFNNTQVHELQVNMIHQDSRSLPRVYKFWPNGEEEKEEVNCQQLINEIPQSSKMRRKEY